MAIVTQPRDIPVHIDPYSFLSEIQVVSGNPVQNYNRDTQEYEPDRSLVPCILMPYISASDPEGVMNGAQTITGAEWYIGAPNGDGSNRITADTEGYTLSAAGAPAHSLKITKNINYDTPVEIHCVFYYTDKRRQTQETMERSIVLRTTLFDSNNYSLRLDQPKAWTINPLEVTPAADGSWLHTITAQAYSGQEAVPDANAAYWWQILDNGTWREFDEEELEWLVEGKDGNGHWGKTLTFDARMIRTMTVRCRGAYYTGTRPSAPSSENVQAQTTVKVEMPQTLYVDYHQYKGIKVSARMNTPVGMEAVIRYNKNRIANAKVDELTKIEWYAKSSQAGSTAKFIGNGRMIEFIPNKFGFEPQYQLSVYAKVYLYAVTAIVVNGTAAVMDGDKYIVVNKYE